MICLQACATPSKTIVQTKTEIIRPPDMLLVPCVKPKTYRLKTNEDLAYFASSVLLSWESCAAQVDAIRDFFNSVDAELSAESEHEGDGKVMATPP